MLISEGFLKIFHYSLHGMETMAPLDLLFLELYPKEMVSQCRSRLIWSTNGVIGFFKNHLKETIFYKTISEKLQF